MDLARLNRLNLVDGYASTIDGQPVVYKAVELKETTVADEDAAIEAASRPVKTREGWKLLLNEEAYRRHLVLRAIKALHCPGHHAIEGSLLDAGQFSTWDWYAIESRLVLLEMAGQLRHGQIEPDEFSEAVARALGDTSDEAPAPPGRSDGQVAGSSEDHRHPGKIEPLE